MVERHIAKKFDLLRRAILRFTSICGESICKREKAKQTICFAFSLFNSETGSPGQRLAMHSTIVLEGRNLLVHPLDGHLPDAIVGLALITEIDDPSLRFVLEDGRCC